MSMNKVKLGVAALVVGGISYYLFGIPSSMSDGQRSGIVYKISNKWTPASLFISTWEGELNLGASCGPASSGNAMVMKPWEFSATDEAAKQIEEKSGACLTLHYTQPIIIGAWFGKSEYLVYKVE